MAANNVIVSYKDNIQIITLNRPAVKNALDLDMYVQITEILKSAAENDSVLITVVTGAGDYFSSGNDLKSAMSRANDIINHAKMIIKQFVDAFIEFPKILVGIVNGPAIGIAVTTLALYDLVFASESAFFYTPFTQLGLVAEGCSTYTFPRLFGRQKAVELLLLNQKMSPSEALQYGFVNCVYKPEEVQSKVWDTIYKAAKLPKNSMLRSKKLITAYSKEELVKANIRETEELGNIWTSEEFFDSMLKFTQNKNSKSKL